MPRFNYQRAREGGMSDEEILQFLDNESAEGRVYSIEAGAARNLMAARSRTMEMDQPQALEANPLVSHELFVGGGINPRNLARPIGRAPVDLVRGAAQGIGSAVNRLRGLPGREVVEAGAELVGGPAGLMARVARAMRGLGGRAVPESVPLPPGATAVPAPAGPLVTEGVEFSAPTVAGVGSSAARVADDVAQTVRPSAPSVRRHNVQYFSESQGKFLDIESMHISQLRNAMNKLQRKLSKFKNPEKRSPVTHETLEAMKREVEHRFREAGGLTIPPDIKQAAKAGKVVGKITPKTAKTPKETRARASAKVPRKGGASMEDQLQQSIALEQEMARLGIPLEVRMAARRDPTILDQLLGGLE